MLVSTTGEADCGQLFGPGKLVQWCQSDCFENWKSKVQRILRTDLQPARIGSLQPDHSTVFLYSLNLVMQALKEHPLSPGRFVHPRLTNVTVALVLHATVHLRVICNQFLIGRLILIAATLHLGSAFHELKTS